MRKKLLLIMTTLGLLVFLAGIVMVTDAVNGLTATSDLPEALQKQAHPAQPGLTSADGTGTGLLVAGAGLTLFGFFLLRKENRLARTHSITFDFSKSDTKNKSRHEPAAHTTENHQSNNFNLYSRIKKRNL